MPSTFRIPKATITGLYGRMLTTYTKRTWGQVPDNAYVMWHNRKVLKAVLSFEQKVARFDALDRDLSVLAQAATAATVGCSWCLDFGTTWGQQRGHGPREDPRGDALARVGRVLAGRARGARVRRGDVDHAAHRHRRDGRLAARAPGGGGPRRADDNDRDRSERARFNSAAGLQAQGYSDVCEVPLPRLASLHAVPSGS